MSAGATAWISFKHRRVELKLHSELKHSVREERAVSHTGSLAADAVFRGFPNHAGKVPAKEPDLTSRVLVLQTEEETRDRQAQEEADRQRAADKAQADAARRQRDAAHGDAIAAFQTLLAEVVRDPGARWQVWCAPMQRNAQLPD